MNNSKTFFEVSPMAQHVALAVREMGLAQRNSQPGADGPPNFPQLGPTVDGCSTISSRHPLTSQPEPNHVPPTGCLPREFLNRISAENPNLWRTIDEVRQKMLDAKECWPKWCFMPGNGWQTVMQEFAKDRLMSSIKSGVLPDFLRIASEAQSHQFFATWRLTQGVYRFDDDLYRALLETPVSGDISAEVLTRLPEWAVYIETPGMTHPAGMPLVGFGALVHHHPIHGDQLDLHLFVQQPNGAQQCGNHTVILNGGSISQSVQTIAKENGQESSSKEQFVASAWNPFTAKLMSLLLWLCSEKPEIGNGTQPGNPIPKKTKKGTRFFAPDLPKSWEVGVRIGGALRKACKSVASGEGADHLSKRPRAHVRRAHWHTFGTGTGRRMPRPKWLSPMLINLQRSESMPATIRRVAGPNNKDAEINANL